MFLQCVAYNMVQTIFYKSSIAELDLGEGPIIKITRIRARRMILIYNEIIYWRMSEEYEE